MKNTFKKILMTSAFLSTISIIQPVMASASDPSINDLSVNKYDCSVQETENYMLKRTASIRRSTSIATWDDFKENAVLITNSANGGTVPSNAYAGESTNGGVNASSSGGGGLFSDCPVFADNLKFSNLNFDFNFSFNTNVIENLIEKAKKAIEDELKKGICSRIDMSKLEANMNAERKKYFDTFSSAALSDVSNQVNQNVQNDTGRSLSNWTGYSLQDLVNGNNSAPNGTASTVSNNIVDNALSDSLGNTGKILNVYDPRLDQTRINARDNEVKRQENKLTNKILGK